ncbi:MAG: transposase [Paracoccaceae bacterium]|nr:transposase [Paracoccaceae bacterium]
MFAGLTPRRSQSGEREGAGRIPKGGDRDLRRPPHQSLESNSHDPCWQGRQAGTREKAAKTCRCCREDRDHPALNPAQ